MDQQDYSMDAIVKRSAIATNVGPERQALVFIRKDDLAHLMSKIQIVPVFVAADGTKTEGNHGIY